MNREALRTAMLAGDERTIDLALDVAEAALRYHGTTDIERRDDCTLCAALDRLDAVLLEPAGHSEGEPTT